MSPISNYQTPGVYVVQSGTSLTTVSPSALNIAILADQATPATATDTFYNVAAISGINIGALSTPMVNTSSTGTYASYSGYSVTWVSGTTTITGTYGVNFTISPPTAGSAFSYLTTSGTASGVGLPSGTVGITYGHNWGAYGTYTSYNALANTVGLPTSGTTVTNPAVLAANFAFQNGASSVSILPIARIATSNSGIATTSDWARTLSTNVTGSDPTYLTNLVGVDVIVPLYGFVNTSGTNFGQIITYGAGTVASGINAYLNTQAAAGTLQRAFVGVDGTSNQVTTAALQALATSFNSSRISLVYPTVISYNPGINSSTGVLNNAFNIPGYYAAAAVAGVFVGQSSVSTPVTNKTIQGFNSIPNQISAIDAQTNYLPYGILTIRQKRDGNFWILHGLTTNITSWLTQEISINAIGDELTKQIRTDLNNSQLVGGALTNVTSAAVIGVVQASLTNALANGLIQGYQNLSLAIYPATPTTVNVTFQYAPTYPINYIQTTLSLNTQTGTVVGQNVQSNLVTY